MGQALYRKHRPKSLSEVVGQEHITDTLAKAIKSGRISHAYLFTGPKGVGKTSVARILAHEINGLPYTDESAHMDIIEIDAASNRRIDEIRELRDKVYIAPTSAKYKVYIIDEVHMLTREAFNALLKTLEEPPAHVVFILATTDAHKLPETIISRTQRFTFKPVDRQKVIDHLRRIAKQEKIKVSDDALQLLAEHGEGSFRDSISLLDQAGNQEGTVVELTTVQELLGIPSTESIDQLVQGIVSGDAGQLLNTLLQLYEQGYQAAGIVKQLAARLRQELTAGQSALDHSTILSVLAKLIEVPASHNPERYLELVLLATTTPAPTATAVKTAPRSLVAAAKPKPTPKAATAEPVVAPPNESEPEPTASATATSVPTQTTSVLDEAIWPEVLDALKKQYNTLYGIVRMAQPRFEPGKIELGFAFAFHQKRIMDAKNRKILADIIARLTGANVEISCILNKDLLHTKNPPKAVASTDLSTISNIFGGAELLNE